VSGLTDSEGMLCQSYRYDPFGGIDFGKPQYNNVYAYNAESYNGNTEHQYLRARYYDTDTADFITEDSYLGKINDPLTLNRYNYVKSSPLNYTDPSGHIPLTSWADTLASIGSGVVENIQDIISSLIAAYKSINDFINNGQTSGTLSLGMLKIGGISIDLSIEKAELTGMTGDCDSIKQFISTTLGAIYELQLIAAKMAGLSNATIEFIDSSIDAGLS